MSALSDAALITIEVDLDKYNASLDKFIKAFGVSLDEILRSEAFDLQRRIQQKTPVLTGRLRNSFHTVAPGFSDTFAYRDNRGGAFDGSLSVKAGPSEAIVGTNVPYAIHIEAGGSRKAPEGMVAVSVREKTGDLNRALEERMKKDWDEASR